MPDSGPSSGNGHAVAVNTVSFRWEQTTLIGKKMSGKVTVQVLKINKQTRVMLRENLLFEGRFPPRG
jgi:hypothetical protein